MTEPTAAPDPELAALAGRCVAAPADEAARLRLAAALQRRGRADAAGVVGGPTGEDVARFAAAAGADLLFVADQLTGRYGWDDRDPTQSAAVFALVVRRNAAHERSVAAVLSAADQISAAVAEVHAAVQAGVDAIGRAVGATPVDALLAANQRLLDVTEAVTRVSQAAGPFYLTAEAARAAG